MPQKTDKPAKPRKKTDAGAAPEKHAFPVVGIGASAGGLDAVTRLLHKLPADTGMAFVIVQHLDPKHASLLPELLARATSMSVAEIEDGMAIEPNRVYVLGPNHGLALLHGALRLLPRREGKHLPIDDFLSTLAEDLQTNAIGAILSGTASDGTLGLKAIKAAGGITFAQSEESAEYGGMPHSAIAAGHVDFALAPEALADELARIARHPYTRQEMLEHHAAARADESGDLGRVFVLLRSRTGHDFTYYKQSTIQRRIKRRMVLHQLERIDDYVRLLQKQPPELDALFQDILINVTSFFRDPETFEALKTEVFPRLLEKRPAEAPLRLWVPACSTGEEAYSLAIALVEFLGERASRTPIQIFATDIDDKAIDQARRGFYPEGIRADVSAERLQRFFIRTGNGYQVGKAIRDACVFAVQNVTKDPPFSKIDLVVCRNLMIYLGTTLQHKVLHTFHYALRAGGFLMLGTSETIGALAELFALADKKHKIYAKKTAATRPSYDFGAHPHAVAHQAEERPAAEHTPAAPDMQQEAERTILAAYGPPGVIVNQDLQILHFRGETGPYIEPAPGSASLNLLKMARQDLAMDLRELLRQAIDGNVKARKEGLHIHHHRRTLALNLQVIPLRQTQAAGRCFLVLFEPVSETPQEKPAEEAAATPEAAVHRIRELEQELLNSRQYLQSIIEEREAANEELQSANEEIQSANEELQSTNEELETAKEELQSTNEELATINEEHDIRNQELGRVNNDLTNLLASVDLAVLILGEDLRIRRFTPKAKSLLNLIDTDVGRPIGNIRPNVVLPDLEQRALEVIETMTHQSLEVQDLQGHWYALRIRPYKTLDNRIEGTVMTFIDIDNIKDAARAREALRQEQRLAAVLRDAGELIPRGAKGETADLIGRLKRGEAAAPVELARQTRDGRQIKVRLTATALPDEAGKPALIAITEREIGR
ncbi:MAG: chemotaxis protein CheB [Sulfuricella sp.]|nr:chemotaxis protein CheB [Sulfuricella sp.]